MVFLFSLTIFVGSTLLFLVEPMFAKMVLPMLGGTPAVWNTCMLFFQAALLAGYAYTHFSTSKLKLNLQIPVHAILVLIPLSLLPVHIAAGWSPPSSPNPIPWLLLVLTVFVGAPFFVVSTGATMIQKWFSESGHHSAMDPYFLYAASNAGSIVGLLGYIVVFEPNFTLAEQSHLWTYGYMVLVALTLICAGWAYRSAPRTVSEAEIPKHNQPDASDVPLPPVEESALYSDAEQITTARRIRWIALSFVPSSLLLGVTTYITTDIAAIPLLWVLPLTLYLLSFIFVFSRSKLLSQGWPVRILAPAVLIQMVVLNRTQVPLPYAPILHLFTFFTAAMACHGALAVDRPHAKRLTEFYLLMSVGGALGGVFNAIVAPLVFRTVAEYPIALALACYLFLVTRGDKPATKPAEARLWATDVVFAVGLAIVAGVVVYALNTITHPKSNSLASLLDVGLLALVAAVCFAFSGRPLRFGLGLAGILLAISVSPGARQQTIFSARDFFGIIRIARDPIRNAHILMHGTTVHGIQWRNAGERDVPLTYYSRGGPIGQVFEMEQKRAPKIAVGAIGLGAGTIASYARPSDSMTFYEIDPNVVRVAEDANYFSYISDAQSRGAMVQTVLGDGRLKIAQAADKIFDLIVLDAFSSDSIPVHLLTTQAMAIYETKLKDGGVIAVHISNRFMDLRPVVAGIAESLDLKCIYRTDMSVAQSNVTKGVAQSRWVALARDQRDFGILNQNKDWKPAKTIPGMRTWTDDFSNILDVMLRARNR